MTTCMPSTLYGPARQTFLSIALERRSARNDGTEIWNSRMATVALSL
jgi:hypothetical protein